MRESLRAVWTIALQTGRRKWVGLLVFALGALLFQYTLVASYPAIGGTLAVNQVLRTFPPALRRLLKIAPNLGASFTLADYLALGFFHPVFLGLGSAFVVGRATDALAGEIERGSIYLLLSRPLPRWALVIGKQIEMLVGAGIIAVAGWVGLLAGTTTTALPTAATPIRYLPIALAAWALFAALGSGALIISSFGRRSNVVAGLGTIWTLATFMLDVLPATADTLPAVLNPWHHYDPPSMLSSGTFSSTSLVVLMAWVIVGGVVASAYFSRRDLA